MCFIGKVDFKEFLKKEANVKETKGSVLDENGKIIGDHDGAIFYTIGERHGFTITLKGTNDKPLYVARKDMANNTITVAPKIDKKESAEKEIKIDSTNWIGFVPEDDTEVYVRFRYRQPLQKAVIKDINKEEKTATLTVGGGESADFIASGQSAVLYVEDMCIGGGIISA